MQLDKEGNVVARSALVKTGSDGCFTVPVTKGADYDPKDPSTWSNYSDFMSSFEQGDTGAFVLMRPGETGSWMKEKAGEVKQALDRLFAPNKDKE